MHAWASRTRVRAAAAFGIATTVALLPVTAFGAEQDSDLGVGNKGWIMANGAAIVIPYSYSCPEGWRGSMWLNVVQAHGNTFSSGGNGKSVECTGQNTDAKLFLKANVYDKTTPFRSGAASIVASMDVYDPAAQCGEYEPCPMPAEPAMSETPPPAAAPAPATRTTKPPTGKSGPAAADTPTTPSDVKPSPMPTSNHSDWNGTIMLANSGGGR